MARRKAAELALVDNEPRDWFRIADGEVFTMTRLELWENFGIPLDRSRYVLSSKSRNKTVKGFAPVGTDVVSGRIDKTVYSLRRLSDDEVLLVTRKQMAEELKLSRGCINGLVYKLTTSTGGFVRSDSDTEVSRKSFVGSNLFDFLHVETGQIVSKTCAQMTEEFGISSKKLGKLRNGHTKKSHGFVCVGLTRDNLEVKPTQNTVLTEPISY